MRWRKVSLALLAAATACLSGTAHAARWNVGVFLGPPAPYYYPPVPAPYYYAPYPAYPPFPPYPAYAPYPPAYYGPPVDYGPPVVIQPPEPDVYIERSQTAPLNTQRASSGRTWWYCAASKSYYPYVKDCSSGWREVPNAPEQKR